jgi:hypothetical protein
MRHKSPIFTYNQVKDPRGMALMATPALNTPHASHPQLILHALDQSDEGLAAHLEVCETCRTQAQAYRAVLAATRQAFGTATGTVNVVSLGEPVVLESTECDVGDDQHTLRVTLRTVGDVLHGQLTVDETCTCWQGAPVRLFGPHGLVASDRVDENRSFVFPCPSRVSAIAWVWCLPGTTCPSYRLLAAFWSAKTTDRHQQTRQSATRG